MTDQASLVDTIHSAAELAERLGGTLEGDGSRCLRDVATLEQARPDSLSWVGASKLVQSARESKAGALIVPLDCEPIPGPSLIRVADPDMALREALRCFAPPANTVEPGVHATAVIGAGAVTDGAAIGAHAYVGAGTVVGAGTQLHPGVYVGPDSAIGRDCVLWPNVVVRERATIGDRVEIHPNVTIGADGYAYIMRDGVHLKVPQIGSVVIEDDVEIGANSTVDRARSGITRIGRGTKMDNHVHIGHNCDIGEHCIFVAGCVVGGSTSLGHHVVLGGHVGIADHIRVGSGVRIGGKSSVTTDVPEGQVVCGIPVIDNRRYVRQQAAVRKLPEWIERVRDLCKRMDRVEGRERDAGKE